MNENENSSFPKISRKMAAHKSGIFYNPTYGFMGSWRASLTRENREMGRASKARVEMTREKVIIDTQ